ncbi:hypothetical protein KY285_019437 [Solanum tuberosum]|nr:hypothetical protein KY285_019437 [Solanum tuberosum]
MADAFVSFAVQKLGDFLLQVFLRKNLRKEVELLRNELLFIQSFLREAEQNQCADQRVQQWVFEINSIANDAVAILETYSFEAGKRDDDRFASRLKARRLGRRRNSTMSPRRFNHSSNESWISVANETLMDVVEILLAEILKAEPRRRVLSIYGMGGLGKTTLARNLYRSPSIVNTFPTRAWICVSQEYNKMDLIKTIIKSIQGCTKETLDLLERMAERDLEIYLRKLLTERKYLVVVDDVWQREAWKSLERAFPDSNNGSRVIITTRKVDVAERADDRGFVHELCFLTQEESWDLFCRKLLDVRAMVPAMERLAKDMVEKCRGLPLAIVVLSGLLSHKGGLDEWKKVKHCLWKNIEDDSIEISYILSLSYNDLSIVLKQCFLYFDIFPEDQVVNAENIIWLWMAAKGFIPNGEERMEDVAEGFLNELIRRSLIQVVGTSWEKVTVCRVHDLLRDLAIQKASEINFFSIYDPRKHSISSSCIRHAIHSQGERYLSLDLSNLKLRSIMFFDPYFCNVFRLIDVFRYLYVLYLDIGGGVIPNAIGSLYHLNFLSLRGSMDNLHSSIGNLKNLQTLRVVNETGRLCQLPPETADLINLRHLVAPYSEPLVRINKLTSLEVLKDISCDQWKDVDPVALVNLRELTMCNIWKSYSLNNISSLTNLSTLTLFSEEVKSFPSLEFVNRCEKLQKLCLNGRIEKLPLFPNSITMMILRDLVLTEDPMPILGMLPNLMNLELFRAYEGEEITCNDNSFSQLKFIYLGFLSNLERWDLGTSAMPLIKGLHIYDCPKLKEIPERMKGMKRI